MFQIATLDGLQLEIYSKTVRNYPQSALAEKSLLSSVHLPYLPGRRTLLDALHVVDYPWVHVILS